MADEGKDGFSGSCLCGAVHYESVVAPEFVGQCHCEDCRKTSGTDHATNLMVPKERLSVTGPVKSFTRPADSGHEISRSFCPECGTPVTITNSAMPDKIFVPASSLDDLEIAKPHMIVFASRAPSWRHLDPDIPAFAEMPDRPEA